MPVQNGGVKLESSYLEYLPALYQDDEFMGQFLLIFESILKPIENTVNNAPYYFRIKRRKGAVAVGYVADLVVFDDLKRFNARMVF